MYLCVRVSFPSLYQAMKVSGHVFVCEGIVTKPVPSHESEWSCICVLGYRYQACTKPGK